MRIYLLTLLFLLGANVALAQTNYTPLAPIEQLTGGGETVDVSTFIPRLVQLTIGIAGGLAVIMIIIGGIKYMSTDAWGAKNDAKNTIQNALLGLLLAISAYTILNTVNPDLVNLDLVIEGQSTGGEINTETGGTNRTAVELGCTNDCEPINPNNIPLKTPGACTNNPCYLHEDLIEDLEDLADALEGEVGWQVTLAYPSPAPPDSNAGCWGRGNLAGSCVFIAPLLTRSASINIFLGGIDEELSKDKYNIFYNACGSRLTSLRNDTDLTAVSKSYLSCVSATGPEGVRVSLKSV